MSDSYVSFKKPWIKIHGYKIGRAHGTGGIIDLLDLIFGWKGNLKPIPLSAIGTTDLVAIEFILLFIRFIEWKIYSILLAKNIWFICFI